MEELTSLLVLTEKYLLNNGYVYNIYCGLTTIWCYCKVCKKNSWQTPLQERGIVGTEKYVCTNCRSFSQLVG